MEISLNNKSASLTVNLFGGAITDFHLNDDAQINPLNFVFTQKQMPENNRRGAPYRGHFLCLGRWGMPSEGEIKAGVPNHGEIANILWKKMTAAKTFAEMETTGSLEGLHIKRTIQLDASNPVFRVTETVTNIHPLGRMYNMVQHPTLAAPFLNASTIIQCNGSSGFDQASYKNAEKNIFTWPHVKDAKGNSVDLRNPARKYDSVFSFVVDKNEKTGWITAYAPGFNLLFGYAWEREDYPWIHLWQHWEDDVITYRGIEFGTAGIHQPFKEIMNTATVFGERTFDYIDAGESVSKKYFSFLYKPAEKFWGVDSIQIAGDRINIMMTKNKNISLLVTN